MIAYTGLNEVTISFKSCILFAHLRRTIYALRLQIQK